MYPSLFILRRLLFVFILIRYDSFTWLQISMQFTFSIGMIIYFGHVWPFRIHKTTKTELMNEAVTMCLSYFLFCFTDWIAEANTRYLIGYLFITVISTLLLVHLSIIAYETVTNTKDNIKRLKYKRRAKNYKFRQENAKSHEDDKLNEITPQRYSSTSLMNSRNSTKLIDIFANDETNGEP